MSSYLPGTKLLFNVRNDVWPDTEDDEPLDDQHAIDALLTDWHNELYSQLDESERKHGKWPSNHELLAALRAALAEQNGNAAGEKLAYSLVRCGCRAEATIAGLGKWDAQLFRWSAAGWKAEDLFAKFQAIGAAGNPAQEELQMLNQWLADPAAYLANYGSGKLASTLFKGRTAIGSLYQNGAYPEFAELFTDLARITSPALPISNVTQAATEDQNEDLSADIQAQMDDLIPPELQDLPIFSEADSTWQIQFDFAGTSETIYVQSNSTWLNDTVVALQFDRILARQGRCERVVRFAGGRNDDDAFWGKYIIVNPVPFATLCAEVGIPLQDFTGVLKANT